MKAVALTGLRQMELVDVPKPRIENDTDILLKIEMVGVCGSDVHYYETGHIGSQIVEYPFIIGHECAATIAAVGSSVSRVKVGDDVVVDPAVWCGECDQCRAGRENTCRNGSRFWKWSDTDSPYHWLVRNHYLIRIIHATILY